MKRSWVFRLFLIALVLRLTMALGLNLGGQLFSGLSRDSIQYHYVGTQIASHLEFGEVGPRMSWTDDAWFRVVGHIYYWFGPHPLVVQILNALLGSLAVVMTARMALLAYGDQRVSYFAGWLIAVFPSFIYFNSLLLKDAASLFLISTLGWATVALRQRFAWRYVLVVLACLVGYLGIREYFFFVGGLLVVLCLAPVFGRGATSAKGLLAMAAIFALVAFQLGYGAFGSDFFATSRYTDIDYINDTRQSLSRGAGAMGGAGWGDSILTDIESLITGVYYFLFSINPLEVESERQLLAIPEMLTIMLAMLPLCRGVALTWRHYRATAVPLLILGVGVLTVYVSATTNMGALYRWRMQAFPFLFAVLAAGLLTKESLRNPLSILMRSMTRRLTSSTSITGRRRWRQP